MQTWAKYALSFFALILVLTGFIFAFGPASTRNAFNSGETQTGQLRADHQTVNVGEPVTESGTTTPAAADAPGTVSQPQGPNELTNDNGPTKVEGPGYDTSNPSAVPAK